MSEQVALLITALAVFVLLSDLTLNARREEIQPEIEKKEFFFQHLRHGTSVTGGWTGKDYVVDMKIKSLDYNLDMRLVFKDEKGFRNVNVITDINDNKLKHGKTYNLETCAVNGTRPLYNRTCKPRPPSFMTKAYNTCERITVTAANWTWNGAVRAGNTLLNGTMTMADGVYSGVISTASWTWKGMTWLAEEAWDGAMWMGEWAWDKVTWLADWIWYRLSWLAGGIWDVVSWFGDSVAVFYAEHLKSHVTYIKARCADLTWQDVFSSVAKLLVANVCLVFLCLLIVYPVKVILRRRRARLEREAVECLAAADNKPMWRPKPKKKRRKNQKDW